MRLLVEDDGLRNDPLTMTGLEVLCYHLVDKPSASVVHVSPDQVHQVVLSTY